MPLWRRKKIDAVFFYPATLYRKMPHQGKKLLRGKLKGESWETREDNWKEEKKRDPGKKTGDIAGRVSEGKMFALFCSKLTQVKARNFFNNKYFLMQLKNKKN